MNDTYHRHCGNDGRCNRIAVVIALERHVSDAVIVVGFCFLCGKQIFELANLCARFQESGV